jgi:hypothetical protein
MNPESLIGFYRIDSGQDAKSVQRRGDPALATERHHMKEHNVNTMDIELIDAALNAPTGLDGLAADMADLAGRKPTKWEQVGRLCVSAGARLRSARRIGYSPASAHNHGCR